MRKLLCFSLAVIFVLALVGCSNVKTNSEKVTENVKTSISSNTTYELSDLRVVSEDEGKSAVVIATLKKTGDINLFIPFTEEIIKISDIAAKENGLTIQYVNTIINLTEDEFLGWTTEGALYTKDGDISKEVTLEKLQSILLEKYIYKGLYLDPNTLTSEEKNYIDAIQAYNTGNFANAKVLFEMQPDYKDSSLILKKLSAILPLQGAWQNDKTSYKVIINGWEYSSIHYSVINKEDVSDIYTFTIEVNDDLTIVKNNLYSQARGVLELNADGKLVERDTPDAEDMEIFTFISSSTILPEITKEPTIGMTESEVIISSWGVPSKKNRTTTAAGTTQQWVYKNGYIYFDKDGLVTSIQNK